MSVEEPLITLILPVYNMQPYLERCMKSLLAQTWHNLEILFVDDGSTDQSGAMCDAFARDNPHVVSLHKANGGLSDARNYGIAHAHGSYIAFIDPDDTVDADYVEYLYQLIEKYHTRLSVCRHRVKYPDGTLLDPGRNGDEALSAEHSLERMLYSGGIDTSAWAKMYEISLFDGITYPVGKIFEDLATTYRLILKCDRIACGCESKYSYRLTNGSISNSHQFNSQYFDYPDITDAAVKEICRIYPGLGRAGWARRVRARISAINLMINYNVDQTCKETLQEHKRFIREHTGKILPDKKVSKQVKLAVMLMNAGYGAYRRIWLLHRKKGYGVFRRRGIV